MTSGVLGKFSTRFFLAFLLLGLCLTAVGGGMLLHRADQALERELGERLMSLAAVIAADQDERALSSLQEGDERTAIYAYMKSRLEAIRDRVGARRVYIFTAQGEALVDTEGIPIGTPYGQFKAFKSVLPAIRAGRSEASLLYRQGKIQYKTGFSPLKSRDRILAGVGVEASARYLEVLDDFKRSFYIILAVAVVLGGLTAYGLARSLSRPLDALIRATDDLTHGRMDHAVVLRSGTEMDRLGEALDLLRREVLKRDQNLKMMLAQIAHEIKNPLGIFQLYLPLLSAPGTTPEVREAHVRLLKSEAAGLNHLLNEFITFVRRKKPAIERVEVGEVFQRLEDFFKEKAARQGVVLAQSVPEPLGMAADGMYVWHALFNLAKNGLESMEAGGRLSLAAEHKDGRVLLRVSDTGCGIPPDILPRIFEPFFTTKAQGSGLGLSVVADYMQAMGGRIRVDSEIGRGTRITLDLPESEAPCPSC